MLVSGTMSESEITSSFPDMLAELSKGSSAFRLQGITMNIKKKKMQENKIKKAKILTALLYLWDEPRSSSVFADLCTSTPTDL